MTDKKRPTNSEEEVLFLVIIASFHKLKLATDAHKLSLRCCILKLSTDFSSIKAIKDFIYHFLVLWLRTQQ